MYKFDRQSNKDLKVVGNKNTHKTMIDNIIGEKNKCKNSSLHRWSYYL